MKCIHNGMMTDTPPDTCQGVVFLEPSDVVTNPQAQFSQETFSMVLSALLFAFIAGHVIGRVLRLMGKA